MKKAGSRWESRPFPDFSGGAWALVVRLSTAYSHNKLEVQAKKSKVYQFEMLQTNLVNFRLVVWAVTAYFSCTMWDGNVHNWFVLFLLRRSTSSTTQSVQSSTASSWTNTSDEEKLSPLTSHPLSCITHKIVTFTCKSVAHPRLHVRSLACRMTSHGHGFNHG